MYKKATNRHVQTPDLFWVTFLALVSSRHSLIKTQNDMLLATSMLTPDRDLNP